MLDDTKTQSDQEEKLLKLWSIGAIRELEASGWDLSSSADPHGELARSLKLARDSCLAGISINQLSDGLVIFLCMVKLSEIRENKKKRFIPIEIWPD